MAGKEEEEMIKIGGKEYKKFADGNYDVVILGTGLTNSLLAAILSTKKKMSVLHVDKNAYYGGEGASLQLTELLKHFGRGEEETSKDAMKTKFGSTRGYNIDLIPKLIMAKGTLIQYLVKVHVEKYVEFNILDASYVFQKGGTIGKVPATGSEAVSTSLVGFFQKRRLKNFLQFLHNVPKEQIEINETRSIDFQDGPLGLKLMPLIASSKCGAHVTSVQAEGQAAATKRVRSGDILTHVAGKDVRGTPYPDILKIIKTAKRPLAVSFQAPPSKRDGKWDLVTHSAKEMYEYWVLEEDTQDFVSHAMGLYSTDEHLSQPAFYCLAALNLYKESALRYGKSPFLFPKYGLSEMPQGFARLCALSGGVQSLRVNVEDLIMGESGKVEGLGVKYDGEVQGVRATRVVASPEYFQDKGAMNSSTKMRSVGKVVRSICIMNHPIPKTSKDAQAVQLILPQKQTGRKHDVYITCMGDSFKVAPKGYYVAIVSTTVETDSPLKEVEQGIQLLGPIIDRFDKVSDVFVPASGNDGANTNIFATSSFDATSHFETVIQDVSSVYEKITGEKLDLTE